MAANSQNGKTYNLGHPTYYINRELGLLEFQQRVLEEAQDASNPLLDEVHVTGVANGQTRRGVVYDMEILSTIIRGFEHQTCSIALSPEANHIGFNSRGIEDQRLRSRYRKQRTTAYRSCGRG